MKKGIAALAVMVLALSPAFGALCAMPCGAGGEGTGGSCCCRPAGDSAAEVLAGPSCCTTEVKASDPGMPVRATVNVKALELPTASVCTAEETAAVAGLQWPTPSHDSPGNARSSPLFLLHASFII